MRRTASAWWVAARYRARTAQHYPYKECVADGKKEGLTEEEAEYRCKYIACCVSKRQNPFKERGYCKTFDCDKKPKWSGKKARRNCCRGGR
jgi:hypothetical protein